MTLVPIVKGLSCLRLTPFSSPGVWKVLPTSWLPAPHPPTSVNIHFCNCQHQEWKGISFITSHLWQKLAGYLLWWVPLSLSPHAPHHQVSFTAIFPAPGTAYGTQPLLRKYRRSNDWMVRLYPHLTSQTWALDAWGQPLSTFLCCLSQDVQRSHGSPCCLLGLLSLNFHVESERWSTQPLVKQTSFPGLQMTLSPGRCHLSGRQSCYWENGQWWDLPGKKNVKYAPCPVLGRDPRSVASMLFPPLFPMTA